MPRSSDQPPGTQLVYRHADPATDAALDWLLRLREGCSPAEDAAFRQWRDAQRWSQEIGPVAKLWRLRKD